MSRINVKVGSDEVALGIRSENVGQESAGSVKCRENAFAQNKSMGAWSFGVESHDVATRTDAPGISREGAWGIDLREGAFAKYEAVLACGVKVAPHDVAGVINPIRAGRS